MTLSKPKGSVPPPAGQRPTPAYARFIPREELQGFAAWSPDSWSDGAAQTAAGRAEAEAPQATPADIEATVRAARQSGYEDGYRDGQVALEAFKRSHASQVSAQLQALITSLNGEIETIDNQMADAIASTALKLAKQVIRSELSIEPNHVVKVAQEAVGALLLSARHVRVRVNPNDHALVADGAAEALAARGAQVIADAAVERGGCVVESDLGRVDAQVAHRWQQALAAFGRDEAWAEPRETAR
jgi:flagellar assembly protein FliH